MSVASEVAAPGLFERLGDRLNPILVKEVRQALRGRYFRISFMLTLLAASVVSLGWLVFRVGSFEPDGRPLGVPFYTIHLGALIIATHGLVPFSAFVAMGAEWDENTYDLLVLSNLRPRQIVLGKVLAAGAQALLFYSAFGPFLVFAFLLRGIDLFVLLMTLGGSFITSFALSCLAVSLSSLARHRFLRVTLMGLLAAFLITGAIMPAIAAAGTLMRFPGQMHDPEAIAAVVGVLAMILAAGILFVLIACARLAHPEENRSTGLRIYSLALPFVFLGWISWLGFEFGFVEEMLLVATLAAQAFIALAALFFATEPERLGRRVRRQVPRRPVLALLAAPFLPGGGRGLLWFGLANALILLWLVGTVLTATSLDPSWRGPSEAQWRVPLVAAAMAFADIGVASLLFSARTEELRFRISARVFGLALAVGVVLLPALVGFFVGSDVLMSFEGPFNPLYVLYSLFSDRPQDVRGAPGTFGMVALIVLVASSLRLVSSLREVLGARHRAAARGPTPDVAGEQVG